MRLALSIALAFALLAACNRPVQAPEVDVLATRVAATLTAQPPAAEPTITPSATALPTTTLVPSETPEVSETPSPTVTRSATAPAMPTDDPRYGLNLAEPDSQVDFSHPFAWFPRNDDAATIVQEDGRLRATDNLTDGYLGWSGSSLQAADSYAEVSVEVGACGGKDAYGFAVRVGGEGFDQGYTLEVACDGTYRIRKFISFDQTPVVLLDWTASALIHSGSNATNVIGLVADGPDLSPVFNGERVRATLVHDTAYEAGFFSLFSSAAQTDGLTVYFDDFKLWTLPP